MSKTKLFLFSAATFIFFFAGLEAISRLFFVLPGTFDYVERRIIEEGLTGHKPKDEFRMIFYGESTMHGDAYHPESSIDQWVMLYLKDLLEPEVFERVKAYNLARLGCNSHFITRSFLDTVSYKPNMAIFYTAHNDFVQLDNRHTNFDPKPKQFGQKGYWSEQLREWVKQSALLSEINRQSIRLKVLRHKIRDRKKPLKEPTKIENWEKFYNPVYDAIRQDSEKFEVILNNWKNNIETIIQKSQTSHIPIFLIKQVANYKDFAPNESGHSESYKSKSDLWTQIDQLAKKSAKEGRFIEALKLYHRSLQIDREYALTFYEMGRLYEKIGRWRAANRFYKLASDKDIVPLRGPQTVNRYYDEIRFRRPKGVWVVNSTEVLEKNSPNGIIDHELVIDPTHPNVKGQALIAYEIVRMIYEQSLIPGNPSWSWDKIRSFDEYKSKLEVDHKVELRVLLSKAHYIGRFYDKAIEYSLAALKIDPHSSEAKRHLAWAFWRKGDKDKAIQIYHDIRKQNASAYREAIRNEPLISKQLLLRRRLSRLNQNIPTYPV